MSADVRCGTPSGYSRHQHLSEKPCDACAAAKREYDQRWRSADARTKSSRMAARAQGRASTRLRALYPDVWAALYAEEKSRLINEATA